MISPSFLYLGLVGLTATVLPASSQEPTRHAPQETSGAVSPLSYPGVDIGAKTDAAFAAMPESGGAVRIPAGHYDFSTTITLPRGGYHLQCDAGAVLHYTGNGDAILIQPVRAVFGMNVTIDGEGGCLLSGNPGARSGIRMLPSNSTAVLGMRIFDFAHGNGIQLDGANSVEITRNVISGTAHAIDMVTVPHYAPNAVHVTNNEISENDWGVYSHNGHVPATRALANVYRDNVLEGNHTGDIYLGWDAHTIVEGNYFESTGVAVAAGAGTDNVYDIHVLRNYFTTNGKLGYRSEVELGYGDGFSIEGNYEEGPKGPGSGCSVNAIPGPNGGIRGVVLRSAFSRFSEGAISAHEFCYRGNPSIPAGVLDQIRVGGGIDTQGGSVSLGHGEITSTEMEIHAGASCSPDGMLLISTPPGHTAQLFFCSGDTWKAVVQPRP